MSKGVDPSQSLSPDHERAIDGFARSLTLAFFLKHFLRLVAGWLFAWGLLTLVFRASAVLSNRTLAWGSVGIVPCLLVAALRAKRETPRRAAVQAMLDEHNRCGGLLMAATDAEIGDWRSSLPELTTPRARFRSRRATGFLLLATAFALLSLAIPVRMMRTDVSRPLDASKEAEDLKARVEILKEAQVLEEEKAKELEQKLDQITAESSGDDPARTWEALDHLSDAIEKTAGDAAAQLAARRSALERAEALAEGLAAGHEQLDAKVMTEAMATLESLMQNAMKENQMLADELSGETAEAIKAGALGPGQLGRISKALNRAKSALDANRSKLSKAGAVNPNALKGGATQSSRDNSGLAEFLKENASEMSIEDALAQWCEKPGKGGVSRGRADAAMTWTDGTSEKGAKFKEQMLPPSAVAGLDESQIVGLSVAAPTTDNSGPAAHGALNSARSGGGSAYTQPIPPRHKAAVQRYFERK
jgi:hypothetical protein